MRYLILILLLSAVNTRSVTTVEQFQNPNPKKKQEIILIGDCITAGNRYLYNYLNNDKQTMINYGVSGVTVQKSIMPMMTTDVFRMTLG